MPNTLPNQSTFQVVTNSQTATIPYPTSGFGTYSLTATTATITNFSTITFFVTAGATLSIAGGTQIERSPLVSTNALFVATGTAQQFKILAEDFGTNQVATITVTASGATIYMIIS
jgi:hypothetical protein